MTTTEQVSSGIYRIDLAGADKPQCLTHTERNVTILPVVVPPDPNQQWEIHFENENLIIEVPSPLIPKTYLSYDGAPKKPEEHDQLVLKVFEFPPNEWHLVPVAPGTRVVYIRVAGSDLGIKIAPPDIHPPILDLGLENQLEWVFVAVKPE